MNDYFLEIWIRQRHEEINAELGVIRRPQQKRQRMTCRMIHIFRSFLPGGKMPVVKRSPVVEERDII